MIYASPNERNVVILAVGLEAGLKSDVLLELFEVKVS